MGKAKLTLEYLNKEICKREEAKTEGYRLRANHVSACLKHLLDIFAEYEVEYRQSEDGSGFIGPTTAFLNEQIPKRIKAIRKAKEGK